MISANKGDREKLGNRIKCSQFWAEVFGWIVGTGLLVEYGNEIIDCFVNLHWPSLPLIGGVLVTFGVFGEVFFSRLVLTTSDELQKHADSDVSQANKHAAEAIERTEELRKQNQKAAAALETERRKRVDLAISLLPRRFEDQSGAIEKLRKFSGTTAVIEYEEDREALALAQQINWVLTYAGWMVSGRLKTVWMPFGGVNVLVGNHPILDDPGPQSEQNMQAIRELEPLNEAGGVLTRELAKSGLCETNPILENLLPAPSRTATVPFKTILVAVGMKQRRVLDEALEELGPRARPTFVNGVGMSGNRRPFSE